MIEKLTALQLGHEIKKGNIRIKEAVSAALEQIEKYEAEYHCFISVQPEEAFKQADQIQKELDAGGYADSPLAGVPMGIKDNICTEGILTSCGSQMLSNFLPPYNAFVVERLKAHGGVILGKLNMDEFAMGSTTETSYYGATKNPWNPQHVPGGSSGGCAAAVAANEAFYCLGSDTGGSIRQPSSYCGVVGLKPTYGTVSRYGLIAYASSLDQIGPLTKDVADCAVVYQAIAGYDKKDSTSVAHHEHQFSDMLHRDLKGIKIGIPVNYLGDGLDDEVKKAIYQAAEVLKEQGAIVKTFTLPLVEYAVPAYYIIASAEASSNLSRYDGVKYGYRTDDAENLEQVYKNSRSQGFGSEVKRRMMIGAYVLSAGYYDAYYLKALRVRTLIKQSFDQAFENYDIILSPVAPQTAPLLGESLKDPLKMYLSDIYTVSVNLAGVPAISVPCGLDHKGLPIGLQMIGKAFSEKMLLQAAYNYEQARGCISDKGAKKMAYKQHMDFEKEAE